MLQMEKEVQEQYPGTTFGVMIMKGLTIADNKQDLSEVESELLASLRQQFAGKEKSELRSLKPFSDYHEYYRKFRKTYHVLHQCESVVEGKKQLPSGASLLKAMFMAEIKNQLLTAGYDCSEITPPFKVGLADGKAGFNSMGSVQRTPPKNDIMLTCGDQILGSIICGPDHHHRIKSTTSNILFAVYGVPGVSPNQIEDHFNTIKNYIQIMDSNADITAMEIH